MDAFLFLENIKVMILKLDFTNKIVTLEQGILLSALVRKMHELFPHEHDEWEIHPSYVQQQYIYPNYGTELTTTNPNTPFTFTTSNTNNGK